MTYNIIFTYDLSNIDNSILKVSYVTNSFKECIRYRKYLIKEGILNTIYQCDELKEIIDYIVDNRNNIIIKEDYKSKKWFMIFKDDKSKTKHFLTETDVYFYLYKNIKDLIIYHDTLKIF